VISRYVQNALRRARYQELENHGYCATVSGLRGVVATGRSLEECREQLAEVIEEWVLVRVARGLNVPAMGGQKVQVRKAS
jgi:predicted RNase H-like HicB family nuclease